MRKKQAEKVEISGQVLEVVETQLAALKDQLERFQEELRSRGEYDTLGGRKGDPVAFKPSPYEDENYVLGNVVSYQVETGFYELNDDDDKAKIYLVPESSVSGRQDLSL